MVMQRSLGLTGAMVRAEVHLSLYGRYGMSLLCLARKPAHQGSLERPLRLQTLPPCSTKRIQTRKFQMKKQDSWG